MIPNTARPWLAYLFATVAATLVATRASAQTSATEGIQQPAWEASGSVGLHQVRVSDVGHAGTFDHWAQQWDLRAQAGRYLTPHLKIELGVLAPRSYEFYEDDAVPVPGLPSGLGFAPIDRNVRALSIAPAVTWQFFDNSFVHPYVTGGVDLDVLNVRRFREAGPISIQLSSTRTVRYEVTGIDTRETEIRARPFIAFGSKSYFNSQWFARPEVQVGFARSRASQVSLRLGIGVDF